MPTTVLELPTLVLNKSWLAISVRTVEQAIGKVSSGQAKIVDPQDYQQYTWADWQRLKPADGELCVRSVRFNIRVPDVIILTQYDRMYSRDLVFNRRNLFARDKNTCQYCGRKCSTGDLSVEHVTPRSQGGESSWTNCVVACLKCNVKKANRTPQQARMTLLREPTKPKWTPVFRTKMVKPSWEKFISEVYWNIELEK